MAFAASTPQLGLRRGKRRDITSETALRRRHSLHGASSLGARWTGNDDDARYRRGLGANAYVTRMHLRYDAASFPEHLALTETTDHRNFQGRYVRHHPRLGAAACAVGEHYHAALPVHFKQETKNLASVTG